MGYSLTWPIKTEISIPIWLTEHQVRKNINLKPRNDICRGGEAPDPDLFFGKARLIEMKRNFGACLDMISQTIVTFHNFTPALIEKMRLQLALQDWDQVLDTANRWVFLISFHSLS